MCQQVKVIAFHNSPIRHPIVTLKPYSDTMSHDIVQHEWHMQKNKGFVSV